ncbi:uncharacterized protein LOC131642933 [Vicia villosa]|uniref:uncharacterized protein LOC131642933 n=1 Tax=Vicia villosa TaxID=3911 RepID=UPI00273C53C0|nr:uncharacterized protein LOC131642933 [Vicia villosa]
MTKTNYFIFLCCVQILIIIVTIESSKDENQFGAIEETKRKIGMIGWGGWKVMGRRENDNGGEKEGEKGEEVQEEGEKEEGERDEESEEENENEQNPGGAGSWGWGGNAKNGYGQSGGRAGSWGWGGLFGSKN